MSQTPKFQAHHALIHTALELLNLAAAAVCETDTEAAYRASALAEAAGGIAAANGYIRKGIADSGPRVFTDACTYAARAIEDHTRQVRPILGHLSMTLSTRVEFLRNPPTHVVETFKAMGTACQSQSN